MEGDDTLILEINLMSAQGLKRPSTNLRRIQTFAFVWVHPSVKLRTRVDELGGENPTWNDKFLFRVSPNFISGDTSAVTVEIYAAGFVKNFFMGSVRFVLSSCLTKPFVHDLIGNSAFTAVQVRRPSGKFHGILNLAAAVHNNEDFPLLKDLSAISFIDLMSKNVKDKESSHSLRRGRLGRLGSKKCFRSSDGESCDFDTTSFDFCYGTKSTSSSSSAASTNPLNDLNGLKKMFAGKLGFRKRKVHNYCLSSVHRTAPVESNRSKRIFRGNWNSFS